jgi:hypothetical protein
MEMLKGENSFWDPYFQVINTCDLPMTWSEEDLVEFQDVVLKTTLTNYRSDFEDEWLLVFDCAKKNSEFFTGILEKSQKETKAIFCKAFCSVVTRCFGWGLICTTMVPYADFINHHNVDSSYELISKDINPNSEGDQRGGLPDAYFTVSKGEINYKALYEPEHQTDDFDDMQI